LGESTTANVFHDEEGGAVDSIEIVNVSDVAVAEFGEGESFAAKLFAVGIAG